MPNYYPTYYPNYYQPQPQPSNFQSLSDPSSSGRIWVQGEAGAKSYLVAPNNTVTLWDSENKSIYLKSADATGKPTTTVLDYTVRENMPQNTPEHPRTDFATKDDISIIEDKINALDDKIRALNNKKKEARHESDDE